MINPKNNMQYNVDDECLIGKPYNTTMENKYIALLMALVIISAIFKNYKETHTPQLTKTITLLAYCPEINK